MKEAWRLQKNALDQKLKDRHKHLAVFFIYVGNEIPDHQLVVDKTGDILKRLLKITDENCLADT